MLVQPPTAGGAFFKLAGGTACKTLQAAFERYMGLTFTHRTSAAKAASLAAPHAGASTILSVTITVADQSEAHPQLETDESYTLSIGVDGIAAITAATIYGVMHALETFSQLVVFDFDQGQHTVPLAPWTIKDAPRYAHRGLMIDTARHFEPVATIKRIVDSLPYAKVNVLHWHMVVRYCNIPPASIQVTSPRNL